MYIVQLVSSFYVCFMVYIKKFYEPESLLGKKIIIVNNLKSRKMKFGESEGMLLAADNDEKVYLIEIDKDVINGAKIR